MKIKKMRLKVYNMTCSSCENRVENAIKNLPGIVSVKASYSKQCADIELDSERCTLENIKSAINNVGYSTQNSNDYKIMGILIVVAAIVLLGMNTSGFDMEAKLANASYAILFVVGVLTSIHCLGMCGGIMLSQSLSRESNSKFESLIPSILYNLGRVVSYTILGGMIGALGSVFSLSITSKAALQMFAGIFMIIMGFNMTGFSVFRKLSIKLPISACKIKNKSGSPFVVGVLNGFMPCGPLQTMQLFALGTGSAFKGALSMFMFSVGTVPLMLTFGAVSGLLSKGYTKKILKFSGVLIIVLGLIMGNRGLALAGININPLTALTTTSKDLLGKTSNNSSNANVSKATLKDGIQIINMTADNNGYTPNAFYVQKGIPVKWIIDGKELNSCNNAIVAQSLNLEKKLNKGENIIEFTPVDKDINFSCWMGMIRGVIKVVDKLDSVDTSKADSSLPPASNGPSCCAAPLDESSDSGASTKESIYGSDITVVPTETIINKASSSGKYYNATFKGIGYEFKPLIIVTEISLKTKVTFDLNSFDNPEDKFEVLDLSTGDTVTTFSGNKGVNELILSPRKPGSYGIVKDDNLLGIVEVVKNIKTIDLSSIRQKYLN